MHTVEVIAHRGASAQAPENTLAAFDLAIALGSDAIETDVRCTRDGVLVLCHDATVDRVSNGSGAVAELTLAELQALDFGSRGAPHYAGQRIVQTEDFLARYGSRLPLVLEIKAAAAVLPLVQAVHSASLLEQVVFTSFDYAWLEQVHALSPAARIGYLSRVFDAALIARVRASGFAQVCPRANLLTRPLVDAAHAAGLTVRAWGIDSQETQEHALQMGADGMTVNWPDLLIRRLLKLGWR